MSELTHFNKNGEAHMVDVGLKNISHRVAIATGTVTMLPETLTKIIVGNHKKGDVLGIARVAGIMGAKRTSDLIPLCHPIALDHLTVDFKINKSKSQIVCKATAEIHAKTGVEMEALMAVNAALLTIYDMCKAVDRGMVIDQVRLLEKKGGKSGHFIAP